MADVDYKVAFMPRHTHAHAARRAVLWPLAIRSDGANEAQITEACLNLLDMWRARLWALQKAGWSRLTDPVKGGLKVSYARNCWPEMIAMKADTRYRACWLRDVCPWCYARKVIELFKTVDRHSGRDMKLFAATANIAADGSRSVEFFLERYVKKMRLLANLEGQDAEGIYWALTMEPMISGSESREDRWLIRPRFLAIQKAEATPIEIMDERWHATTVDNITNHEIANVIASVCRYPVGLMHGDAERTVKILEARSSYRLSESLGKFRVKAKEKT